MAASQGYYGPLASLPDEPTPPDGIGEACDSHTPRLITGASAIEEMAMGGGAPPPPPSAREMHPLGLARAMSGPLEHSFERSDVPPAPGSLEELIIERPSRALFEGESLDECAAIFMAIEEAVRPTRPTPPTPQRPSPTRTRRTRRTRRAGQTDCLTLQTRCHTPPPHAPKRDGKRSSRAPRSSFFCEKPVPRS